MIIKATAAHIPDILQVRLSVNENKLVDSTSVSSADVAEYLTSRGAGWVYVIDDLVAGFAIVDLREHSVWALFVHPTYEGRGIGKQLHDHLLNCYFNEEHETLRLSTDPGTRAEIFYLKAGWKSTGLLENGEAGFLMTRQDWEFRSGN